MNKDTPAIVFENVTKRYGDLRALDGLGLSIPQGEWVAIMGASGSGKTTLLNILDGLDHPTNGCVQVLGVNLVELAPDQATTFRREHLGLVFQQFHLIPYLTALENVMLAQYYHSLVDRDQAHRVLESVQMDQRAGHVPAKLSGGEQQRVCIARALVNDPQIILADEPTGNLDEVNEKKVVEIFRALHRAGKTIVMVTHNRALAEIAQRQIHLRHGRVLEDVRTGRDNALCSAA